MTYDFQDEENANGITEFNQKNRFQYKAWNHVILSYCKTDVPANSSGTSVEVKCEFIQDFVAMCAERDILLEKMQKQKNQKNEQRS